MPDALAQLSPLATPAPARRPGRLLRALRRPATGIATLVVALHLLMAATAPLWAPYDTSAMLDAPLAPPGAEFWFGTDLLGRDYFSRIVSGGQVALLVASLGVAGALAAGTIVGLACGYLRGGLDEAVSRLVDALMAVPEFLLISILVLALGKSLPALAAVVAVVYFAGVVRVVRARTIALAALDFVRAAELRGEPRLVVLLRELLPNLLPILAVEAPVRISAAVLRISALSFLGLGISPPTPDWGLMVQEAMTVILTDPWLLLFPAALLSSFVVAVNFAVDGFAAAYGLRGDTGA
jgi:peptide/nickel transport system permease protein